MCDVCYNPARWFLNEDNRGAHHQPMGIFKCITGYNFLQMAIQLRAIVEKLANFEMVALFRSHYSYLSLASWQDSTSLKLLLDSNKEEDSCNKH